MLQGWVVIAVALGYIGLLFLVASYGDRTRDLRRDGGARFLIYPLSLAIYCTSWTFFGSVGSASRTGYEFLTIYIGPVMMIGLFSPLLMRIVRLAKAQNITSIADFIAARYGKGQAVAATVAADRDRRHGSLYRAAAQSGVVLARNHPRPYLAACRRSRSSAVRRHFAVRGAVDGDLRGAVRHPPHRRHRAPGRLDAGDRHRVAGQAVRFPRGRHFRHLLDVRRPRRAVEPRPRHIPQTAALFLRESGTRQFLATTLLSFVAIILLPRQFHVAVVENNNEGEIRRAAWLFPLYLVLINLFVVPIAIAGLLTFPKGLDRQRHVRAGAAAPGRVEHSHHRRIRRRPVGGNRHGDRGIGRALDHGVQRSGHSGWCCSGARP